MPNDIREGIQQAFFSNYGEICESIFEEWPDANTFAFGVQSDEELMARLALNLHRYRRPADERFICWAKAWVRRETRRHRFLSEDFDKYFRLLLAAISRGLYLAPEDWAVEPMDHLANIRLHLLENPKKIDGILAPEKGKSTSVLYGLARSRMRAVRTKVSDRHAKVVNRLDDFLNAPGIPIADPQEEYEENLSAA
jgi:hypothetical protein